MDQEILIIAVQKRPCIYDKSDPKYHNREYLRKSWDEISFEVNETSKFIFLILVFKLIYLYSIPLVESCQKRWRYLRDYYIKQRRLYMKSDGTRKKIWPFFDMLSFLNPFLQTYAEYTDNEIKDDEYNNLSANGQMEEELINEDFMDEYHQQTSSGTPAAKRTKLSGKLNKRIEMEQSDDHEYFFKSLLPMARSMDQSKILQFRIEVQQVLMKYINSSNSNYSSALNCLEDVLSVKREAQE